MKTLFSIVYVSIVIMSVSIAYWIAGNNDAEVEKQIYCEIKFNQSKATVPCNVTDNNYVMEVSL